MRIEARNLTMCFNDAGRVIEVFRDLNLEVESGRSLSIVGKSGSGKTTLLHLLGTIESPTAGSVKLGDQSVTDGSLSRDQLAQFRGQNIGFIFQFHYLLPEFDAVENVAMPLLVQGEDANSAYRKAADLLDRVGLAERATHRPAALSGGEQQRVAIARALVTTPGLLLADEPTGNLDLHTGAEIHSLLLQVQREAGITMVVVTHSLELARAMDTMVELTSEGIVSRSQRS